MLKLLVRFNLFEAVFDDDLFCGYRFVRIHDQVFDTWFDVLKFVDDYFSPEMKCDVVNVCPIKV